jgi:endonuclease/exonuclease/phosphatase family metal-dependent hydrolase
VSILHQRLVIVALLVLAGCGGSGDGTPPEPYELRLGTWNIERLGQETDTDYPLVARIIDDNFDVIAIQEIMVEDGGHPGYDRLLAELGAQWDGLVTDRPRPDVMSSWAEYYAVLWRRGIARPCEGWAGLVYHDDEPADVFSREPAFVCLEAGFDMGPGTGTTGLDFVLASYHAIYAGGDRDVTRAEVDHLDDVLAAMAAAQPGEEDIVIAGDFNLEQADIESLVDAHVLSEGPTGSTLTDAGHISGNLIDHVIVGSRTSTSEAGPALVLDVRSAAATFPAFRETVSNHLPVMTRFTVSVDDD